MRVHFDSTLLGAAFAVLLVIAIGAQSPIPVLKCRVPHANEQVIKVKGIPAPEDMVRIIEGSPFVVPEGRVFVATGVGVDHEVAPGRAEIRFDGVSVFYRQWRNIFGGANGFASESSVPPGLVAPPGTVVTVDNSLGATYKAILLGYLADTQQGGL